MTWQIGVDIFRQIGINGGMKERIMKKVEDPPRRRDSGLPDPILQEVVPGILQDREIFRIYSGCHHGVWVGRYFSLAEAIHAQREAKADERGRAPKEMRLWQRSCTMLCRKECQ